MRDVKFLPRYRAEKVLRDKFLSSNLAGCAPSEQAEDCKKEKLDPLIGRYLSLVKKKYAYHANSSSALQMPKQCR